MGKKLHIGVRVGRFGAQAIARAPAIIPYYLAIVNKKIVRFRTISNNYYEAKLNIPKLYIQ